MRSIKVALVALVALTLSESAVACAADATQMKNARTFLENQARAKSIFGWLHSGATFGSVTYVPQLFSFRQ